MKIISLKKPLQIGLCNKAQHSCLSELLKSCINLGGDTDSVAAIAVGLATCFIEYKKDLPIQLYNNLNEDKYGISFLQNLEKKFFEENLI
ncbi:ADP-ribosylglycohydrolase family protein [Acinetobacter baumannii]|uniref:ADP-ribosylglycohydrolase family protein n=1 Tax=Acinetobacter baumannii TaxID=470 RepID=UPI0035D029EB